MPNGDRVAIQSTEGSNTWSGGGTRGGGGRGGSTLEISCGSCDDDKSKYTEMTAVTGKTMSHLGCRRNEGD